MYLAHFFQTKADFSYAIAVMYRIGGWIEEGRIVRLEEDWQQADGSTEAVICNGQDYMDGIRNQQRYSILEAISCVCANVQENHEWVSEFSLVLQEN